MKHYTVAVHVYQAIIINYLKINFNPKKLYYFTDGAGQYFKNKNGFSDHENDFGIPAEWHFHATAHGKGACDGIGANIKRNAARYSLQCSVENRILTAKALFDWTQKYCKETITFYSGKEAHVEMAQKIKKRFDETIESTLQYHAFIPQQNKKLQLKKYSSASVCRYFTKKPPKNYFPSFSTKKNKKKMQKM